MLINGYHCFTSESVCEGHPDKVADQISDAILDGLLKGDPHSRVACETMVTTGLAVVSGEITTRIYVDIPQIVRSTIKDIGYTRAKYGFDNETCGVVTSINKQSVDIAMGVDTGGAGDQGMMFGFACNETEELMPLPIMLAHKLCMKLSEIRKDDILKYLRPDGKSQVTVEYDGDKPVKVSAIVVSAQHSSQIQLSTLRNDIIEKVIKPVIPENMIDEKNVVYHINPTGRFVVGGPMGDCGLTGRKIIVDTYGGMGRHGGGCFSGKDPSKVDRSAAYASRWIAKNIVASDIVSKCEIQLAYAIGVAEPVSIMVNSFETGLIPDSEIENIVNKIFDLTPKSIIETLDLRRPIYKETASYGHFGRDCFPWEKTDRALIIKEMAGKLGA